MKTIKHQRLSTSTNRQFVMTRDIAAPRKLVFEALSDPEHLGHWMAGLPGSILEICESDFRVGGKFRQVWRGPDGTKMVLRGEYREIVSPARLVRAETLKFGSGQPETEKLATIELTEQDGTTTLTLTVLDSAREPISKDSANIPLTHTSFEGDSWLPSRPPRDRKARPRKLASRPAPSPRLPKSRLSTST